MQARRLGGVRRRVRPRSPAIEKTYGFHLKADQLLTLSGGNTAATLRAAAEGTSGVNAAMAYGTDGELAALGLIALCDDKGAQIVYAPAPVVRQSVLDADPDIAPLLDKVFSTLTLETLQSLNAKVSVDGEDAGKVAKDYLTAKHPAAVTASRHGEPIRSLSPWPSSRPRQSPPAAFLTTAPNRLLSGKPVMLWDAAGIPGAMAIVLMVAAIAAGAFVRQRISGAVLGAALLVAILLVAGDAAGRTRGVVSLGATFWILLCVAARAVVDGLQRARTGPLAMLGAALAILAVVASLAWSGEFDPLSLAREYQAKREVLWPDDAPAHRARRRLRAAAIAIGVPLGLLSIRRERRAGRFSADAQPVADDPVDRPLRSHDRPAFGARLWRRRTGAGLHCADAIRAVAGRAEHGGGPRGDRRGGGRRGARDGDDAAADPVAGRGAACGAGAPGRAACRRGADDRAHRFVVAALIGAGEDSGSFVFEGLGQ